MFRSMRPAEILARRGVERLRDRKLPMVLRPTLVLPWRAGRRCGEVPARPQRLPSNTTLVPLVLVTDADAPTLLRRLGATFH